MTKTYTRRTPEERIAEPEAKIADVKARAVGKEATQNHHAKAVLPAAKAHLTNRPGCWTRQQTARRSKLG